MIISITPIPHATPRAPHMAVKVADVALIFTDECLRGCAMRGLSIWQSDGEYHVSLPCGVGDVWQGYAQLEHAILTQFTKAEATA